MRYSLFLSDDVKAKIRALPNELRRQIGYRIFLLQEDLSGDVTKLKGSKADYRLRIGSFRVIFKLVGTEIRIYNVGDRKGIYR
jgi:mRNA interferase RelE/StbE